MFKQVIFLLSIVFANGLKLQTGEKYTIEWDNSKNTLVNLGLDINVNGSWISHTEDNSDFLSVILDNKIGEYEWDIPSELSTYWKEDSRIRVVDMIRNDIILEEHFNFYGLTFKHIEDTTFNSTLNIDWDTNLDKNMSISLVNEQIAYLIVENFIGNSYQWNLPTLPEDDYYIQINEFKSNTFHISEFIEDTSKDNTDDDNSNTVDNKDDKRFDLCFKKNSCKIPIITLITLVAIVVLICCCYCLCK